MSNLSRGGFLLEAEHVGRVRFYRLNPRAAYDGSSGQQRKATEHARHPVVPCLLDAKEETA